MCGVYKCQPSTILWMTHKHKRTSTGGAQRSTKKKQRARVHGISNNEQTARDRNATHKNRSILIAKKKRKIYKCIITQLNRKTHKFFTKLSIFIRITQNYAMTGQKKGKKMENLPENMNCKQIKQLYELEAVVLRQLKSHPRELHYAKVMKTLI